MIDTNQRLHSPEPVSIGAYMLRPVTRGDITEYTELARAGDIEINGTTQLTRQMIEGEWNEPSFDLENGLRFAVDASDGTPVAFASQFAHPSLPVRPWSHSFVLPGHRGRGIGTALMQWHIERAKLHFAEVPADARIVLQNDAHDATTGAAELLTNFGFERTRSSFTMRIDMDAPPPAPVWPDGTTLTTLSETPDFARFITTSRDGFRDHRGWIETPFEEALERWQHYVAGNPLHDPSMWTLAVHPDGDAGITFSQMSDTYPDTGWVDQLAVAPAFRRMGVGLALLHHVFGTFWERGVNSVALGVDGSSLTNAVALYQRAGMRIYKKFDIYELELRPGREMTKQ